MEVFAIAIVFGIITAAIANSRGRNVFGWGVFGFALFIVALPCILLMPALNQRKCPYCTSVISQEATVCPHCRKDRRGSECLSAGFIRIPAVLRSTIRPLFPSPSSGPAGQDGGG